MATLGSTFFDLIDLYKNQEGDSRQIPLTIVFRSGQSSGRHHTKRAMGNVRAIEIGVLQRPVEHRASKVLPGEVGLAVGKGGEKIKRFRSMTNKQVEIYEYMNEAEKFIKNALKPAKVKDIRIVDRMEGKKIAMVNVETKDKGIAIGKNGDNIKKIRFLSKRYFQLDTVVIN